MNKHVAAALAAAALAILAAAGYFTHRHVTAPPARSATVAVHAPESARRIVGSADDVFHGTVVRHAGRRTIAEIPSDLYEVRVGHVFKGGVRGTITLTQPADKPRLAIGGKYVFATASWHDASDEHAVLADARPVPAADLGAPVRGAGGGSSPTVAEYWRDAVDHQIGTTRS
ncbi:hypothetical protein AB0A69_27300 [Streptomyces sp. NPDC045431]|uniref:hypothetical protein n=1 Tax=Streptomyces sp. NPDC045431 TaxID=3155613 RepID=UPI00340D45C8